MSDELELDEGGLGEQPSDLVEPSTLFNGLANSVVSKIFSQYPIPKFLYHYTSSAGLLGIVTEGCLHFSESTFLNDGSENMWGLNVALQCIDEFVSAGTDAEKAVAEQLKQYTDDAVRHFQPVIFCFSGRNNLLNQWRDYGRDVVPYCIEINAPELATGRRPNFEIHITKVIYDLAEQRRLTNDLLTMIHEQAGFLINDRDITFHEALPHYIAAAKELAWLVCRFKNPAFDAEEEWRAMSFRPDINAQRSGESIG